MMSYSVFIFFNTQSLESGICSRVTEHLNSNTKFKQVLSEVLDLYLYFKKSAVEKVDSLIEFHLKSFPPNCTKC